MRVLVVEDDMSHMAAALSVLKGAGVQSQACMCSDDALAGLAAGGVDGIITDLFMPQSFMHPYRHSQDPCGLAVALAAEKLGVPFVICTAGYHHGARYNWICGIGRSRGWPEMVDSYDQSDPEQAEASSKDWARALEKLQALIAEKASKA